ncbi:hypothetical protein EDC01DRAFT_754867 [Geopyxis carbonaria]|nr:hypothetical protein EDC01DRAFT_754867 [Geopyxis carbonaria]
MDTGAISSTVIGIIGLILAALGAAKGMKYLLRQKFQQHEAGTESSSVELEPLNTPSTNYNNAGGERPSSPLVVNNYHGNVMNVYVTGPVQVNVSRDGAGESHGCDSG